MLYEIQGTYGSYNTPCTVFVYQNDMGYWYCVKGSLNANLTNFRLFDGLDLNCLDINKCITTVEPINSLEELEIAVDL